MIVGIKSAVCTCGKEMDRVGGALGGAYASQDSYYCADCQKHVIVVTPNQEEQADFSNRLLAHRKE